MKSEGQKFADEHNVDAFIQTSAVDGSGIDQLFKTVGEASRDRRGARASLALRKKDHTSRMSREVPQDKQCPCTIF